VDLAFLLRLLNCGEVNQGKPTMVRFGATRVVKGTIPQQKQQGLKASK